MNRETWAKLPTDWIRADGLRQFPMGKPGDGVATLKLYMVIAGLAGSPTGTEAPSGAASPTYEELQELSGVSRGAIGPALDRLDGLVYRTRGTGVRPNRYRIAGFPRVGEGGWAKLPIGHLLQGGRLAALSSRSRAHLAALKLYLVVLTFRENRSGWSNISYQRIIDYTAMTRNDVSRGISIAVDRDLVSVQSGRSGGPGVANPRGFNRYFILGLQPAAT